MTRGLLESGPFDGFGAATALAIREPAVAGDGVRNEVLHIERYHLEYDRGIDTVLRGPARRLRRARGRRGQARDLLVGVVPITNLEWIQKLHCDKTMRGYRQNAVIDTILRRMPDYVNYICPQFSCKHVNFQRVPTVDTSKPFIAKDAPADTV